MTRLRYITVLLSITGFLLSLNPVCFSQDRDSWFPPQFPDMSRKYYFIDPVTFYMKDSAKGRLDLYIEIPVSNLLFKRNTVNDNFESSIVLTLDIKNSTGQSVIEQTYNETISYTNDEMQKESRSSIYYIKEFYLAPDFYKINFDIKDNNLNKDYPASDSVRIQDLAANNFMLSDIMLLSDYSTDEKGNKTITPLVNKNVAGVKNLYMFFEIYKNVDSSVNKDYSYKILDSKDKIISEGTFAYFLQNSLNKEFEKLDFFNHEPGVYKIQIIDNSTKEIVSRKNFVFSPMHLRGNQFHRDEHRTPRN